jgi:hypothetical protein
LDLRLITAKYRLRNISIHTRSSINSRLSRIFSFDRCHHLNHRSVANIQLMALRQFRLLLGLPANSA